MTVGPAHTCKDLDESLEHLNQIVARHGPSGFGDVMDRLQSERDGARVQRLIQLVLGILNALPREESTTFEFEMLFELIDSTRPTIVALLDFFADGPQSNRQIVPVLREALQQCPRDSLVLTFSDVTGATDLMAALGATLQDDSIVALLLSPPGQRTEGSDGFIAFFRTIVTAVQSPHFDVTELEGLLSFLNTDEPPVSELLKALRDYLQGETLDHLLASLTCLESTELGGETGIDILGGLLFSILNDENIDRGVFLTAAAPLIEQLQDPSLQTIIGSVMDALVYDLNLRELCIDLIVFLLREDNLPAVLDLTAALFEDEGIDDLVLLMSSLLAPCPDPPPDYALSD